MDAVSVAYVEAKPHGFVFDAQVSCLMQNPSASLTHCLSSAANDSGMKLFYPLRVSRIRVIGLSFRRPTCEFIALICSAGATPHAVAIALDRQEKATENGQDAPWSAVQYVREKLGLKVCAIASLAQLLQYLEQDPQSLPYFKAVAAYRERYGAA